MNLENLLQTTIDTNASDLHLVSGHPPFLRIEGVLKSITNEAVYTPDTIKSLLEKSLTTEQLERLTVNKELDFSLAFSNMARFRVNAYTQKGSLAASFRRIPLLIPKIGITQNYLWFYLSSSGFGFSNGPDGSWENNYFGSNYK